VTPTGAQFDFTNLYAEFNRRIALDPIAALYDIAAFNWSTMRCLQNPVTPAGLLESLAQRCRDSAGQAALKD